MSLLACSGKIFAAPMSRPWLYEQALEDAYKTLWGQISLPLPTLAEATDDWYRNLSVTLMWLQPSFAKSTRPDFFLVGFHPMRVPLGCWILLMENPFLHIAQRALPGSSLPGSYCFVWILVLSSFFTPQKIKDNANNIKMPF